MLTDAMRNATTLLWGVALVIALAGALGLMAAWLVDDYSRETGSTRRTRRARRSLAFSMTCIPVLLIGIVLVTT
nr:hypothetical protein [Chromobacterium sp. ASV5]